MNRRRIISGLCALGAGLTTTAALWPAAAERDMSGRWVMAQLSVTVAEVPVVGKIYASTRTVTLHDLEHEGARLHGPGQLCQLELDSGSTFVSTKLPKAFKRSLPRPVIDARLGRDERGNVTISQPKHTVVVGAKLERPLEDPLPSKTGGCDRLRSGSRRSSRGYHRRRWNRLGRDLRRAAELDAIDGLDGRTGGLCGAARAWQRAAHPRSDVLHVGRPAPSATPAEEELVSDDASCRRRNLPTRHGPSLRGG